MRNDFDIGNINVYTFIWMDGGMKGKQGKDLLYRWKTGY